MVAFETFMFLQFEVSTLRPALHSAQLPTSSIKVAIPNGGCSMSFNSSQLPQIVLQSSFPRTICSVAAEVIVIKVRPPKSSE